MRASRTSTGRSFCANRGNSPDVAPEAPEKPDTSGAFVYMETSELDGMSKEELSDFAYRELSISLDPDKSREWMVQQIYRLRIVEEALGRR